MRLLLDTHVLLWLLTDPSRVPRSIRDLISAPQAQAHFSLVSIWEVAIKGSIGKLGMGIAEIAGHLDADGFRRLGLRLERLGAIESLPWLHRDPFDRALVAQSRVESMTLLTADRWLAAYGPTVRVI